MSWVPVGRLALAGVFLLGIVFVAATSGDAGGLLMLLGFFLGTAGTAAWVWRRSHLEGGRLTVRRLRGRAEIDLPADAAVELRREGSLSSPVIQLVVAGSGREAVVASFSPPTAPTILRYCRRSATALGVGFDEDHWRDWLAGGHQRDA